MPSFVPSLIWLLNIPSVTEQIANNEHEFGVESALRALLDPRVWVPVLRAVSRRALMILRKQQPVPSLNPQGGRFGLPADFLIAQDGRVLACKYGSHAYDQWSVDELLALAGVEHQVHQAGS